ncbi:MAG: S-methyl-5-thioribose-1-phosphate isomerase [Candidatus Rifleibacteriota bacterium]
MLESVVYNRQSSTLELLDQTLLPVETRFVDCINEHQTARAIISMQVRGAPAIGVAAAYGIVLGLKNKENHNLSVNEALEKICRLLAETRPTAVNLFWAIERVKKALLASKPENFAEAAEIALQEADRIKAEDIEMCRKIGFYGAEFLKDGQTWLTHCNAGALATAGYGTALGVFRAAKEQGKIFSVFVDETRPLLQGSRLTAWELIQENIDATLICDNMAGGLIRDGKIHAVVVGADRITSKGFVANKIGTYPLAVLARYHGIPFYVAAPASTFDLSLSYGNEIEIEEREHDEVRYIAGKQIAPKDVKVFNPAFDVTPPELITAIFTDRGVIRPVYKETIPQIIGGEARK